MGTRSPVDGKDRFVTLTRSYASTRSRFEPREVVKKWYNGPLTSTATENFIFAEYQAGDSGINGRLTP